MKQILQDLRHGAISIADTPCPVIKSGHLLVQTSASLISPGTERMLVEFGHATLFAKARAQPERVRQVLTKMKTDGVLPTLEAVFSRLDEPLPLGYCNVGRVVEVGDRVDGFTVGDRVVSNGPHAEMVCVPATLAARIPDNVDDETATFTVLGSIALNGVRLLEPTLGESFVVFGLGLVGMLAAQVLRAHGCRVIGIDVDARRCELARSFGCTAFHAGHDANPVRAVEAFSRGRGADGVLISASAKTDQIVHQSAQMCRKRGRIVLVGVVGLDLQRSDFYEKELTFQVACSYGPGRYDSVYESEARDYPLPYVRWTVARNFEAVIDALAEGRIDVRPLISERLPQTDAGHAYDRILTNSGTLGVLLTYPVQPVPMARTIALRPAGAELIPLPAKPLIGVIGAGNFAKVVLLPAIAAARGNVRMVASAGAVTSLHVAQKFGAQAATSDYREILRSHEINTVFIATRHVTHPRMVAEALDAGKHVFVEKPLAIDETGLEEVRRAHARSPHLHLMVGFNRRFAPHAVEVKQRLAGRSQALAITMLVNAGELPLDNWTRDPAVGGGRIIGEACHFIDLALFLVGTPIVSVQAVAAGRDEAPRSHDTMTVTMKFDDGSIATVHYWANGATSHPKERIEIFSEGRVIAIDNWRQLQVYDWPSVSRMRMRQDKGHRVEVASFLDAVAKGAAPLISFAEIEMVTAATFAAVRSATQSVTIQIEYPRIAEAASPATASCTLGCVDQLSKTSESIA